MRPVGDVLVGDRRREVRIRRDALLVAAVQRRGLRVQEDVPRERQLVLEVRVRRVSRSLSPVAVRS